MNLYDVPSIREKGRHFAHLEGIIIMDLTFLHFDQMTKPQQKALDEFVKAVVGMYSSAEGKRGQLERDVVISPCAGANSEIAFWAITLNGSPPKATAIYNPSGAVYWVEPGKPRRLTDGTKPFRIVFELMVQFLEDSARRIPLKQGTALVLLQKGNGESRYD